VTGQIQQLKEMGFSEQQARQALAECVWDVNKALDLLFTRGAPMNGEDAGADAADGENGGVSTSADVSDGKGAVDGSAEARSPVASGKARHAEGVVSGANSPGGADSAEQSTTASTASSPRSSACADKSSGNSTGVSAPLSPQSVVDSGAILAATVDEAAREDAAQDAEVADVNEVPVVEEKTDEPSTEIEVVCAEASAAEEALEAKTPPTKQLMRVSSMWETEGAGAQLCVKQGDFVSTWLSTVTEHGWIYAEDCTHAERAGWLPGCVLEELPSNQRWMRATQSMEAAHETQLSVLEGSVYKVNVDTHTTEGWIYAEASGVTTDSAGDASEESGASVGWVPVFCLEGAASFQE